MICMTATSTVNPFPPIVYKEIGTMFHHVGSAVTSSTNILASLFLKLDLPTLEKIKINCGSCKLPEDSTTDLSNAGCIHTSSTISNPQIGDPIRTPSVSQCLKKCLANGNCTYFTHSYTTIIQTPVCTLRSGNSMEKKKKTNSVTGDINCILKQPSYSCTRSDTSLDQIFEQAFEETSLHYWKAKLSQFELIQRTLNNTEHLSATNKREKRQMAAILPIATSVFSLGFTLFENYKLKKYVDGKLKAFEKFMTNTKKFEEETVRFETQIIHHIETLQTYFDVTYKSIICRENKLALQLLQRQKLADWKDTLNQIFQSLSQGDLTGSIPQGLIETSKIQSLIVKNAMLNTTIYRDYPEFLTTLGSMTIAGANLREGSVYVHVVLSIPTISYRNIFPMYKSEQVGISIGKQCIAFDIPNYVISTKESLHALDAESCKRRNNLWICPFHMDKNLDKSRSCLNGTQDCQSSVVKCKDKAAYSIAGVLIHSPNLVYTVRRQDKLTPLQRPRIDSVDLSKHPLHTEFFSWELYTEIQSEAGIFTALHDASEVIHIQTTWGSNWTKVLASNLQDELGRFTLVSDLEQLNDTVKRQRKILSDLDLETFNVPLSPSVTTIIVIICMGLTLVNTIGLLLLIFGKCYKCSCSNTNSNNMQDKNLLNKKAIKQLAITEAAFSMLSHQM